MVYRIKHVNLRILSCLSLVLIILPTALLLTLSKLGTQLHHPLFFWGWMGSLIGSFVLMLVWNNGIQECEIRPEGLVVKNQLLQWEQLASYKIKDDSSEFLTLKIRTHNHKTYRITHRKKFEEKDDFRQFRIDFEEAVAQANLALEKKIQKHPLLWETKCGKVYGIVLILALLAFTGVLFIVKNPWTATGNYLIVLGTSIPLLIRIFKKKTTAANTP